MPLQTKFSISFWDLYHRPCKDLSVTTPFLSNNFVIYEKYLILVNVSEPFILLSKILSFIYPFLFRSWRQTNESIPFNWFVLRPEGNRRKQTSACLYVNIMKFQIWKHDSLQRFTFLLLFPHLLVVLSFRPKTFNSLQRL